MPKHWEQRDRKLDKRKNGMKIDNRSIFTVRDAQQKRDQKLINRETKTARFWNG